MGIQLTLPGLSGIERNKRQWPCKKRGDSFAVIESHTLLSNFLHQFARLVIRVRYAACIDTDILCLGISVPVIILRSNQMKLINAYRIVLRCVGEQANIVNEWAKVCIAIARKSKQEIFDAENGRLQKNYMKKVGQTCHIPRRSFQAHREQLCVESNSAKDGKHVENARNRSLKICFIKKKCES